MTDYLPPDYSLRAPRQVEAQDVLRLMNLVCNTEGDPNGAGLSLEELKNEWHAPGFNLAHDAWVVTDPGGEIVGYEEMNNRGGFASLQGDGYVHPEHASRGIGTSMLQVLEARALQMMVQAKPGLRVYVRNGMNTHDHAARQLHENEGYRPVRFFWHMEIDLNGPPPPPQWPHDIRVKSLRVGQDEHTIYQVIEEAFAEHWGHVPRSFETWSHRTLNSPDFDPNLYFLAWDGDQAAGGVMCSHHGDLAWVGTLGVRRPWRKRGLGLALLLQAFESFYRRDERHIGLAVDAANETGATRLYERAGMHVARQYVVYEKELRGGKEPADSSA
jgi:mycothiol synthase